MFGLSNETLFFIVAIILFTAFSLWKFKSNKSIQNNAPTILTTTGIFATFISIAIGLYHFDTNNIQASIPILLNSLRTAFWASVFGIGGALFLKFFETFTKTELDEKFEDATVGDLLKEIQLMRKQNNKNLEELAKVQKESLDNLAKMSSAELVKALQEVIMDFNKNLTEQFGENFKQLNQAVHKLVLWQEEYRTSVETITTQLENATQSMQKSSHNFQTVVSLPEHFSNTANSLKLTVESLQSQNNQIVSLMTQLGTLISNASNGLPQIENQILAITNQLKSATEQNQQILTKTVNSFNQQINERITQLDNTLEQELTNSLTKMGEQLATLSGKFVADYTPLTTELQRLVQISRNLK